MKTPIRLVLGLCPTIAITTSLQNSLGMGLATTLVLIGSNLVISLLKDFILIRSEFLRL